jgi:hypothetical protein
MHFALQPCPHANTQHYVLICGMHARKGRASSAARMQQENPLSVEMAREMSILTGWRKHTL